MAEGHCDERFSEVAAQFERNFAERGDLGASVCITFDGRTVVDLWGGYFDAERTRRWERDTKTVIMSCTKGAVSLCAHMLAVAGELDFDAPVVRYWPEFGQAGKDGILVRHLLTHQAGLPALRLPLLEPGAFYDWQLVTERLAAEEPFWEPGTRYGYHGLTFGFLVGEVIRRVTGGTSVGRFFAKEVAEPLGIDFHIGLPAALEGEVSPLLPPVPAAGVRVPEFMTVAMSDPASVQALMLVNNGGYLNPGECNTPAAHAAEIPAAGGVGNARSLARMYAPLATSGEIGGTRFGRAEIARMGAVRSAVSRDAVLLAPARFALGFSKAASTATGGGPEEGVIIAEEAFGHTGMGGSLGFADPAAHASFAFVMNQQGTALGVGPNCQRLVDAMYRALGYTSSAYGFWA